MTLRGQSDAGGKYAEKDMRYWSHAGGSSGAVHSVYIASSIPRFVIVGRQGASLRPLTPGRVARYRIVIASPLRSAFAINPICQRAVTLKG
jgi:hypothetical protein